MVISIAVKLYVSRGTTFSGDGMVLIVTSPDFDWQTALQPHGGHLLLNPRVLYVSLLELFGLSYLPYRILTALAACLTVGLLFTWLIRRVPKWVALVPCLILLFFGTDHLHMLQGNGITICFSLAMGLLSLLMLERDDRRGDVIACVALVVGVATYSVALPFVAGAAVLVLLSRQWRRLWIPAVPLALYLAWVIWSRSQDFGASGGQADLSAAADFPRWVFEASGAAMYGLSGLSFGWSRGDTLDLIDLRAALIATMTIAAVVLCVTKGRSTRVLWAVLSIGLAFWGLQVLVSDDVGRLPDDARYMYPGAVFCLLILGAAGQGFEWRKSAIIGLYLLGAIGLINNAALLARNGDYYREQARVYKANAGAVAIAAGVLVPRAGSVPQIEKSDLVNDPIAVIFLMADIPYGTFAATPEEMLEVPDRSRRAIDSGLVAGIGVKRTTAEGPVRGICTPATADRTGSVAVDIAEGRTVIRSRDGLDELLIGRFADTPSVPLGTLKPGEPALVTIPPDSADVSWKVGGVGAELEVCPQPASKKSWRRDSVTGPGESRSSRG